MNSLPFLRKLHGLILIELNINMLNDNKIVDLFIFLQHEFDHTLTKLILPYCVKRHSDELESNSTKFESLFTNLK